MKIIEKIKNLFKKKKLEITEWYPGNINPVYLGVYQLKVFGKDEYFYGYWDGNYWYIENETEPLIFQYRIWRGIKK